MQSSVCLLETGPFGQTNAESNAVLITAPSFRGECFFDFIYLFVFGASG